MREGDFGISLFSDGCTFSPSKKHPFIKIQQYYDCFRSFKRLKSNGLQSARGASNIVRRRETSFALIGGGGDCIGFWNRGKGEIEPPRREPIFSFPPPLI